MGVNGIKMFESLKKKKKKNPGLDFTRQPDSLDLDEGQSVTVIHCLFHSNIFLVPNPAPHIKYF